MAHTVFRIVSRRSKTDANHGEMTDHVWRDVAQKFCFKIDQTTVEMSRKPLQRYELYRLATLPDIPRQDRPAKSRNLSRIRYLRDSFVDACLVDVEKFVK